MASKFIKNEILGTSRKCSKDEEKKGERRPDRVPDVRHPGGMSAEKNSGCEMSRWNGGGGKNFGCDMFGWNGGGERIPDVICPSGMGDGERILDVICPGGMAAREEFRMRDIRIR